MSYDTILHHLDKNGTVEVDVTTTVENDSDTNKTVTVKNTLLDENGNVASDTTASEVQIAADGSQDVKQSVSVESPELWSVDDANMYKMKTEIVEGNKVLDTYETDYGFRYYNFNNNTGFSLNGEFTINNLIISRNCFFKMTCIIINITIFIFCPTIKSFINY